MPLYCPLGSSRGLGKSGQPPLPLSRSPLRGFGRPLPLLNPPGAPGSAQALLLSAARSPAAWGVSSEQAWVQSWPLACGGLVRVEVGRWAGLTQNRSQCTRLVMLALPPRAVQGERSCWDLAWSPGQPLSTH